jgi:hypothetical protein
MFLMLRAEEDEDAASKRQLKLPDCQIGPTI